jgi:gamma-glutamylputrescine oxidase
MRDAVTVDGATPPLWQDATPRETPSPLSRDVSCAVCVVGLGGSGLLALAVLAEQGIDVVGIDADDVGAGAAGRNGGLLLAGLADFHHNAVQQLGHTHAVEFYRRTLTELDIMFREYPASTRRTGSLRIAASAQELDDCRAQLRQMVADDLPASWYEGPEGQGLLIPSDGVMQPLARVRTLAARAQAARATLYAHTRALAIETGCVITPSAQIACQRVIVAVDGRLEAVLPILAPRVRTARLQMLATAPAHDVQIPRPVYYRDGYEYWQQLPDGTIALGGFRDMALDEEWTHAVVPTAAVQRRLDAFLRSHIGTQANVTHRWAASVSYTESGPPICEEVQDGVFALGAYSGTGNIVGALCAREAAQWAAAGVR